MIRNKLPYISFGKYYIRSLSKKIQNQNGDQSEIQEQKSKIDDQNISQQALHIFPLKNLPIFPENSYVTRINPYLYQELQQNNVKFVSAYLIKENIDFQIKKPQIIINQNEIENQEKSVIDLSPGRQAEQYHQNIIYDDNISNMPYNENQEDPGILKIDSIDQIHEIGTLCRITLRKLKNEKSYDYIALLKGQQRIKVVKIINQDENIQKILSDAFQNNQENIDNRYQTKLANLLRIYLKLKTRVPVNVPELIFDPEDIRTLDILAGFLCLTSFFEKKQIYDLFKIQSIHDRVDFCYDYYFIYEQQLAQQLENLDKQIKVPTDMNQQMQDMKDIYQFLKKQSPKDNNLVEKLKKKSEQKKYPKEIQTIIDQEFYQIQDMSESHPDFNNKIKFIKIIMELPFNQRTYDNFDLEHAKQILDNDHYGLEDVKIRILEFIAVSKLLGFQSGRAILLVGPPGVGKSSVAKSVANCLGRKFAKITLGGENDVSIIKGHRKTYQGANYGKIIQALKNLQTENPVILLDEIDKIGLGFRGNIQDALLEVIDPVQNIGFVDNYLDFKYDLSKVLFICTSNLIDTINPPLLDRLEIIKLSGYITDEKLKIAENYLIPKALEETGLNLYFQKNELKQDIEFKQETIIKLINDYSRESGVRNLQKLIMKIYEKICFNIITEQQNNIKIQSQDLKDYIGLPIYSQQKMYEGIPPPGIMIGLAYNAYGGNILYIETIKCNFDSLTQKNIPEKIENSLIRQGSIKITGSLGDVMQESIQVAYTFAKYFSYNFLNNCFLEQNDIHIHFPEGSSKKDGPSAGLAITASLISLALEKGMKNETAMTGEISLKGKILKIGGVKEKVLAAKRENIINLILPLSNKQDIDDLSENIKSGLQFNFVDNFYEVMPLLFSDVMYNDNIIKNTI